MNKHHSNLLRPAVVGVLLFVGALIVSTGTAAAAPAPAAPQPTPSAPALAAPAAPVVPTPKTPTAPAVPTAPATPSAPAAPSGQVSINLGNSLSKPSDSLTIIISLTLLAVAPALLMMLTSFTRIVIVLSLTRNALGLQAIPPNQVVVGLAMFLSLFVMGPTLSQMNHDAVQPYLHGQMTQQQAYDTGVKPLRAFMLKQTRKPELAMFVKASNQPQPKDAESVSMSAVVPAFVLSELKTAFIIGFIIFIPFLVIDLIVSSSLMSMGMMMLPPVMVSLPFKILLFVLVDGWALIVRSLLTSFH